MTLGQTSRRIALLAADIVLASCSLAALVGVFGWFSDVADQVNNLTPYWALAGLVAAIVAHAIAPRVRLRTIMGAVVVLAGGVLLLPEFASRAEVASSTKGLRLVTFNAWLKNPTPDKAGRWLLAQDADVLILSEVPSASPILSILRPYYPHVTTCMPGGVGRCSTMILTRRRPIHRGGLADGDADGRKALSAAWVEIPAAGGPVTVLGLHLDHPLPLGTGRDEIGQVARFLDGHGRDRLVIAGDLNRTPWSYALRRLDATLAVPRLTRALPTWPADGDVPPMFPIDHVYASAPMAARRIAAGPYVGSDHLPVVADLSTVR